MANRREVLQAGLAASALSATGLGIVFPLAAVAGNRPLALECLVCDDRFADSVAAGRAAARHDIAVHSTSGDMTDLWYYRLDELWRRRPAAIAGVTGEDALFVLERLGWDRGLRVVYRGRHVRGADGSVRHQLTGAQRLVDTLAQPGAGAWTDRFVGALACCPSDVAAEREARYDMDETSRFDGGATVTSWLLAPAVRAARPPMTTSLRSSWTV